MIPKGIWSNSFLLLLLLCASTEARTHVYTHTCTHTRVHTHTCTHTHAGVFPLLIKTVFSSVETCQASTVGIPAESSPNKPWDAGRGVRPLSSVAWIWSFLASFTLNIGIYSRFCDPNAPASRGLFWRGREVRELEGRQNTNWWLPSPAPDQLASPFHFW